MKKNCTYIAVLSTMEYFILCIPCLLSNALKSRYFVKLPSAFILFYFTACCVTERETALLCSRPVCCTSMFVTSLFKRSRRSACACYGVRDIRTATSESAALQLVRK